ncbi:disease resistance protein RPM1-like isoform 1 [Hibiscus syriacus]|uniref:Disease resistance protein RPM1-like isoform 1 n=1 Tax=Hibiscus syriacus TaxID=106335 RepID=A0A6A3CX67_HIBSY|nr:disease resistance protein RPM1-like [Hibiscus syriacus]KAE8731922.1 disease resistance protein RPM1-like isoform 1 [Hibiscus syriacus]
MAESAVQFLLEKLAPLFEKEMQLLRGGREEVAYVRGELERMRAFLRVADALEDTDEELKVWVKQIRDIAHDMEDILDEYMLLLTHHHGRGLSSFLHKMSCCIRNMKARYRIASDIQGINSRIRDICDGHRRLRQRFCADEGSNSNSAGNAWQDRREDALLLDKTDVVGINESKKKLVGWLIDGGTDRRVISLLGMGGLGKTTLAKQVYDDAEVKKHLPIHAWITVSQSFKLESLLKDMVQQLSRVISKPIPDGVDSMSSYQLKTIIKNWLRKRRYLIILDDLWHINGWDAIKFALPANDCGSRVMLTTRNADLAFSSRIESEGEVYNLEPLPPEESWTLFCRKTFRGNCCPPHLEEICKQILKKCAGLPLAIVAISGVLATKNKRRIDEWETIGRSLGAEIDGNDKLMNLKKVLSLSFNDLPYYLKSCFLYLSIFPEDHPIELMKLIRLWIAEGFVETKQGKTQEDVAEDFFNELLNRSLIQVAGMTSDGRVRSCRVHDLVREIIILKSREQNFAVIAKDQTAVWPDKVRRLSIHNTLQNVLQNRFVSQLRSLFVFAVEENPSLHKLFPGGFKLLAVLDMQATPITKFPIDIANLYYLKYLNLRGTKVTIVPKFIGKLHNLETLDLKHAYVTELPVEILQLQRLRHLLVYRYEFESYDYFHSKYGFKGLERIGELQSLQKLCLIEVDQGNVILTELGKLTQLRRLGITKLKKEDGRKLCSSIEKLTCLRALSIISIEENEPIDVQHLVSPPPLLQRLYLRGRLESMPHWIRYLHSLVKLYLKWSLLPEDPLVCLEHLPNLVHLELVHVYDGDTLCFNAGGFKKLKHLGLDNFDELQWVQIQVGSMPGLEKLSIQRCKSMEKVPLGIEHLTKLNVLEFFDMPHELIRSLRQDEQGEDYWRVAHIPDVYSTYWRDGAWEVYSLESFIEGESSPRPNTVISSQDLHARWK